MDSPWRGRPRDPRIDEAVLSATLAELAEHGYEGLSLARVAERAGTSRQAVYRRHPGKPELVAAAVAAVAATEAEPPTPTGEWWSDLAAALDHEAEAFLRADAAAAVGPLLWRGDDDPLGIVARRHVLAPRRRRCRALLRRGIDEGELRADLDVEVTVDLLLGALLARWQAGGRLPSTWPDRVVDALGPALVP